MERTIAVTAQNHPGVVSRFSTLMDRRGFQVKGLGVGHTHRSDRSRFIFVIDGDDRKGEQAVRQLRKMVDALEVEDLSLRKYVERCMVLMKFSFPEAGDGRDAAKQRLFERMERYPYSIVQDGDGTVILEVVGTRESVEACMNEAGELGLTEAAASGPLALGA